MRRSDVVLSDRTVVGVDVEVKKPPSMVYPSLLVGYVVLCFNFGLKSEFHDDKGVQKLKFK